MAGGALAVGTGAAADDLPRDLDGLARSLRVEHRSCTVLIRGYLSRIKARDGRLHSVIAVNRRAVVQAMGLDILPKDRKVALPLFCVPLLVKDNIDVAGLATTAGSAALRRNMAVSDAYAVQALRAAGAIVVAKTNMSEFALNYRGRSSVRGQTRNPLDLSASAGGSSSGNAAALAAGFGLVALGTDTSGSIRVPAAMTGTVGLRPTAGLVPLAGVLPLSPSQDVVGPMCQQARDCDRAMRLIAPSYLPAGEHEAQLSGLNVGILRHLFPADAAAEVSRIEAMLAGQGAHVTEVALADEQVLTGNAEPAGRTARFASRSAFDLPAVLDDYLPGRTAVPPSFTALLRVLESATRAGREDAAVVEELRKTAANRASAGSDERFLINGAFRDTYVLSRIAAVFAGPVDVLVYPGVQARRANLKGGPDTGGTHRLAAYSGHPAVAFPLYWEDGLPVSIELLGRPMSDGWLLALASLLQAPAVPTGGPGGDSSRFSIEGRPAPEGWRRTPGSSPPNR